MGWKEWSYTKKGAVVGAVIGIIITLLGNILDILKIYNIYNLINKVRFFIGTIINTIIGLSLGWLPDLYLRVILLIIYSIIWFSLIGWLIDKKKHNHSNLERN